MIIHFLVELIHTTMIVIKHLLCPPLTCHLSSLSWQGCSFFSSSDKNPLDSVMFSNEVSGLSLERGFNPSFASRTLRARSLAWSKWTRFYIGIFSLDIIQQLQGRFRLQLAFEKLCKSLYLLIEVLVMPLPELTVQYSTKCSTILTSSSIFYLWKDEMNSSKLWHFLSPFLWH